MPGDPKNEFGVFDWKAHTDQSFRKLPHWFQPNVAMFITFRTKDSMPRDVVAAWHQEIKDWLNVKVPRLSESYLNQKNDSESRDTFLPAASDLPKHLRAEYNRIKSAGWQNRLDNCHGDCVLRDPQFAKVVGDTLKFFDGHRYDLASFVVMPNHVHVLVQFREEVKLAKHTESWLRFSAREINKALGKTGPFWQSEPFDHLVRSEQQFVYLLKYIRDNPEKAGLSQGEFLLYEAE